MNKSKLILITLLYIFTFNIKIFALNGIEKQADYYQDSSSYDITFYDINLNIDDFSTYISGYTAITAKAVNKPLNKFYIELFNGLNVDSISINNQKVTFKHELDWIKINLDDAIEVDEYFTVKIYYKGLGSDDELSNINGVCFSNVYGNTEALYTNTEPFYASYFYPCKQVPSDKCDSANLYITVQNGNIAVSNGLLQETVDLPNNKTLFKWETRYPTAFYLLAFAVSDYQEYTYSFYDENYNDSILYQHFLHNNHEHTEE